MARPMGGLGESGRAASGPGELATGSAKVVASAMERVGHVGSAGHNGTGTVPSKRSPQRVNRVLSGSLGVATSVGNLIKIGYGPVSANGDGAHDLQLS